jgi:hypothetical protein
MDDKGKGTPALSIRAFGGGGWKFSSTYFCPRYLLDGGEWSALQPGHFTAGVKMPGIRGMGSCVGSRVGLDVMKLPAFEHWVV